MINPELTDTGLFIIPNKIKNGLNNIRIENLLNITDSYDEECPYDTAEIFLMGSCQLFALALQNIFGYTPYQIIDKNKDLVHCFCIKEISKQTFYIDVRGMTTNYNLFISPFPKYRIHKIIPYDTSQDCSLSNDYDNIGYNFANAIINKYRNFYIYK